MSKTVDERVLEMRFDNRQFESNVSTTMSTLDKLKQKLRFPGATKGLEDVGAAAKKVDLSSIGTSADKVGLKFNAMYSIADQALRNITNSAMMYGKRIVSALTLDPVKTGLSEFETKMNAIQVIQSNTRGKDTMEDITAALEDLNEYADKTIYNFAQMTSNAGKFTAQGFNVKDATNAIKGLANLAAASGASAEDMSRATYQMSQAMGSSIKLMDWNSLRNANMATQELKDTLIALAKVHGIAIDQMIERDGTFEYTLQSGWLTGEMFTEAMNIYSGVYSEAELKNKGFTDAQVKNFQDLAKNAESAATEVKTFSQLWDVLKETAQSGWTQTWEAIFGDFDQSKKLFTGLQVYFSSVINTLSDARNFIVSGVLNFAKPWKSIMDKLDGAGLGGIKKIADALENANKKVEYFQDVVTRVWRGEFNNHGDTPDRRDLLKLAGYDDRVVQELVNKGAQYKLTIEDVEAAHKKFGLTMEGTTEQAAKTTTAFNKLSDTQLEQAGLTKDEIALYRAMEKEAARLGITVDELADKMSKTTGRTLLIESVKNAWQGLVEILNVIKDSWVEIFNPPSSGEIIVRIYGLLESLREFSERLTIIDKETGELTETGNKIMRTFKGIFAIVNIVTTLLGGGFRIAFKLLSTVLGAFDLDILDLTAHIGDAIVKFRDWLFENNSLVTSINKLIDRLPAAINKIKEWFNTFKQTPAVQKFIASIEHITDAFKKLFNGDIDANEFAKTIGANLAKLIKSIPQMAIQIGKDFVAGFKDGIGFSIKDTIKTIVNACLEFVKAFAEALGVQSPSWKAFEIVQDFFRGALNGAKTSLAPLLDIFKVIGNEIIKAFKSFWDFITDESGNIEWGKLFAGGIIFSALWVTKQLATALSGIADAIGEFGQFLDRLGDVLKSFSKVLNAYAWDLKAQALQKLAIAITILVASLWVLTTIDDIGKLWNAVGVIAVLALILVGLAIALDKLTDASLSFKKGEGLNIDGLKMGLTQVGLALLLLAVIVKLVGSMDPEQAKQGFIGLAGMAVGLVAFMAALGLISKFSGSVAGLGKTMVGMSLAMLVMIAVIKLVSKMNPEEVFIGILFMEAFVVLLVQMGLANRAAGNGGKFGSTMLGMAVTMAIMVGVIKLIAGTDPADVLMGIFVMEAFVLLLMQMGLANRAAGKNGKFGSTMLGMAAAMLLMIGVIKLVSGIDTKALFKGLAIMEVFVLLIAEMLLISRLGKDTGKIGGAVLSMAAAIAILAGIAVLLSMVDTASLVKGMVAVGLLSAMMAVMVRGLKGAQNVKGAIMMMAISIALMAGAVVGLSFIDTKSLATATLAISLLMGMFAVMTKSASGAKASLGSMVIMLVTVGVLAGVLVALSLLEVGSTIEIATSIGLLMVALGATMLIISKTGDSAAKALLPMLAITVIAGLVGLMLHGLSLLNPGPTIEIVTSIGLLMTILGTTALLISKAGDNITRAVGPLIILTLIAALLGVLLVELSKCNPGPTIEIATSISLLILALSAAALVLGFAGKIAGNAAVGAAKLIAIITIIGGLLAAVGGLIAMIPGAKEFLENGIPIIELIGKALGSLIGGIIGGIGEGVSNSLPIIAENIKKFMGVIVEVADIARDVEPGDFDGVIAMIAAMAGLTIVGLVEKFTSLLPGDSPMEAFKKNGVAFVDAVAAISDKLSGVTINEEAIESISKCGMMFAELNKALPRTGGIAQDIAGEKDLGGFAESCKAFAGVMIEINEAVSAEGFAVQSELIEELVNAAVPFNELQKALPRTGGIAQDLAGEQDLAGFGEACKAFTSVMIEINEAVSAEGFTINSDNINKVVSAGERFNDLNKALPRTGGVAQDLAGKKDLSGFGEACKAFTSVMIDVGKAVNADDFSIDLAAIETIKQAGLQFNQLQNAIPKSGGWWQAIAGEKDIADFGNKIKAFGSAMSSYSTSVSGFNGTMVSDSLTYAYQIKNFVVNVSGLNSDGLKKFTDSASTVATIMKNYSETVAWINTSAVNTSVTAAEKLKTLIADLVNLDASGISNFKVTGIGSAMKSYSDYAINVNSTAIMDSVTAANKLRTFIGTLAYLDSSGVDNFKVGNIGSTIRSYSESVFGIDPDLIAVSIDSANRIKWFIEGLSGFTTEGVKAFTSAVSTLGTVKISEIISAFSGASEKLQSAGSDMINGLVQGMESKMSAAKEVVDSTIKLINISLKAAGLLFETTGEGIMMSLAEGMSSKEDTVKNAVTKSVSAAASSAKKGYDAFYSAGSHLVSGFASGISDNSYKVTNKAKALAESAAKIVREALDINSPSKVFRAIGYSIPEGLAVGVDKMSWMVKDSALGMTDIAVKGVSSAIARISDAISTDIDAQPTIRPVLDLSDIHAGAGAIGGLLGSGTTFGVTANAGAISAMMNRRGQNGSNSDVVSALDRLSKKMDNINNASYHIDGVTYDDGSNVAEAVRTIVRAAKMERRV